MNIIPPAKYALKHKLYKIASSVAFNVLVQWPASLFLRQLCTLSLKASTPFSLPRGTAFSYATKELHKMADVEALGFTKDLLILFNMVHCL